VSSPGGKTEKKAEKSEKKRDSNKQKREAEGIAYKGAVHISVKFTRRKLSPSRTDKKPSWEKSKAKQ